MQSVLVDEGATCGQPSRPTGSLLRRLALHLRFSRSMLSLFKVLTALCASAVALLYYISLDWPVLVEDQSYGLIAAEGQQARYIIESERCSDITSNCYAVYDAIDMLTSDVNRYLVIQNVQKDYESVARLISPKGIKSKDSDSRFWRVNHTYIHFQYVAVMLTAPFGVSSLTLSGGVDLDAKILIIGLGGGSMNMFLRNRFPKMRIVVVELDPVVVELAWRWFGLEKASEYGEIITMDGAEYINKATARKEVFDVILIDACAKEGDLACPADRFIQSSLVNSLKQILKPTGVVVVNILPHEESVDVVDKVVLTYQKQFPTCAIAKLLHEVNTVLACQVLQQVEPRTSQRLMFTRFQEAWQHFGFSQQFGVTEMSFAENIVVGN